MKELIRLAWEALFLSEAPYAEMRDSPSPVSRGLGLIALIAVLVALVGLVGTALEWATSPNMGDVQQAVLEGMRQMPWYEDMQSHPEAREAFQQQWDLGWRIARQLFAPNIAGDASQIILLPLALALAWLLYGVVAHICARLLGGQGSLAQVLGCTALAIAPQLLKLITFLPYVAVGGVVGTWVLLSRYVALKTSHQLSWGRALIATLLPYVVFGVLLVFFALLGVIVFGAMFQGGILQ